MKKYVFTAILPLKAAKITSRRLRAENKKFFFFKKSKSVTAK